MVLTYQESPWLSGHFPQVGTKPTSDNNHAGVPDIHSRVTYPADQSDFSVGCPLRIERTRRLEEE